MTWSDVVSGILIVVFSTLSANASRRYPWAQWANAVVGGWLLFAPLVFWTPLPEAYANDTLVGGAGDRAVGADPDDAGHEHGRHDGQARHPAGVGL